MREIKNASPLTDCSRKVAENRSVSIVLGIFLALAPLSLREQLRCIGQIDKTLFQIEDNQLRKVGYLVFGEFATLWNSMPMFDAFAATCSSSMLSIPYNIAAERSLHSVAEWLSGGNTLSDRRASLDQHRNLSFLARFSKGDLVERLMPEVVADPFLLETIKSEADVVLISYPDTLPIDRFRPARLARPVIEFGAAADDARIAVQILCAVVSRAAHLQGSRFRLALGLLILWLGIQSCKAFSSKVRSISAKDPKSIRPNNSSRAICQSSDGSARAVAVPHQL